MSDNLDFGIRSMDQLSILREINAELEILYKHFDKAFAACDAELAQFVVG